MIFIRLNAALDDLPVIVNVANIDRIRPAPEGSGAGAVLVMGNQSLAVTETFDEVSRLIK